MSAPTNDGTSHASGANIFWCLMALAFSCMVQQSFIGCAWGRGTFKGTIWPQRSSPLFCLLDSLVDIFGPVKLFFPRSYVGGQDVNDCPGTNSGGTTDEVIQDQVEPIAITMRLAIFFFSVVPQAIQIFSMRGILLTQFMAAAFCFSASVNTVCNLPRASSSTQTNDGKRLRDQPYLWTTKWQPLGRFNTLALLPIFAHLALLMYFCRVVLDRGRPFNMPRGLISPTFSDEIILLPHTLIWTGALIQSAYVITDKIPEMLSVCIGAAPFAFLLVSILDVKNKEKYQSNLINASRILLWLCLASLFVTWLLKACTRHFTRAEQAESNEAAHRDLEASAVAATATFRRQSIDVTDTVVERDDMMFGDSSGDLSMTQTLTHDGSNVPDVEAPNTAGSDTFTSDVLPISNATEYDTDRADGGKSRAFNMFASLVSNVLSAMGSATMWIYRETRVEAFKCYPKRRKPFSYALILPLRYFKANYELQVHCWYSIWKCLRSRSEDEIWMAFGLLNVVTAAIYYLILFDNEGTSAPSWSNLFG